MLSSQKILVKKNFKWLKFQYKPQLNNPHHLLTSYRIRSSVSSLYISTSVQKSRGSDCNLQLGNCHSFLHKTDSIYVAEIFVQQKISSKFFKLFLVELPSYNSTAIHPITPTTIYAAAENTLP